MQQGDKQEFARALQATMELYDKGLSRDAMGMWWHALGGYQLEEVKGGLTRHIQDPDRGRWAPKPADVIAAIQSAYLDQWPSAEQAWAQAIEAADESATVVWQSREAQQAWHQAAQAIYEDGDKVGARVAFKEAYNRLVREAVDAGQSPVSAVSLGHDVQGRRDALTTAVDQGLLSSEAAQRHLPAPEATAEGVAGLLTAGGDGEGGEPAYPAEQLEALRRAASGSRPRSSPASDERGRPDELEAERQRQLSQLQELESQEAAA
ncbi:hypothetical protein [Halorhodospira neutriphila]|uniref:Uncharacterized protein n=1 Tax=Halorhodospira neutriphila TaxID=168379 RepID=A0ABS1E1W3_9GAMM|nr:hypothetical protein [Halorhodospira neutriphila]MBK1725701.1 hypothetical protein [Halorhodospira neutriphila]